MNLSELINLEVQLRRDEQAETRTERAAIERRDRAIGHHVAVAAGLTEDTAQEALARSRALRHAACREWLARLPMDVRRSLPGERIEKGYRTAGWLLFALFVLMGIGTASAALYSSKDQPVNVLVFVVVFFVLQILLLVMYPVLVLIRRVRGGELLPWFHGLLVRVSRLRFIGRLTGQDLDAGELDEAFHQLRLRQTIYGGVQQWLLFTFVQRMALGFNLAALLTSLYMVTFHDLAFCWTTTLSIEPQQLADWLGYIAAPWSFLGEYSAPDLAAIQVSRYVPAEGGYVATPEALRDADVSQLRRTWWPFLVAGLVTWGLLPRALAFAFGALQTQRKSRRLPLNHMAVQHLFERLFPATADWRGPAPEEVRGARPVPAQAVTPRQLAKATTGACVVVCWGTLYGVRDRVGPHVTARFSQPVGAVTGAGQAELEADENALATIRDKKATRVVLALPEGQQPTKDLLRFLQQVRERCGQEIELVVGLLADDGEGFADVAEPELEAWRQRLLAEADPYLTVQTMGLGQ